MVGDAARAKRFYSSVFGWRFEDSPSGYTVHTLIDPGEAARGGMTAKPLAAPTSAPHTYFQVDDIARTLRTVVEAGGTVIVSRTELGSVGTFAMFLDPDRIPIGILEPAKASAR